MLRCRPEVIEQVIELLPTIRLQAFYRRIMASDFEAEPEYAELIQCFTDFEKFSQQQLENLRAKNRALIEQLKRNARGEPLR